MKTGKGKRSSLNAHKLTGIDSLIARLWKYLATKNNCAEYNHIGWMH